MTQHRQWKLNHELLAVLIWTAATITGVLAVIPAGNASSNIERLLAGISCLALLYLGYGMHIEGKAKPPTAHQWIAWSVVLLLIIWFLVRAFVRNGF